MAVDTIDTRPERVNLVGYAGDTLSFHVQCPVGFVAGREWTGQVRPIGRAGEVNATFVITPDDPDGAVVTLTAESTAVLGALGKPMNRGILTYLGSYDVQVAEAGGADPVSTLVQGEIQIDLDVTRVVAAP